MREGGEECVGVIMQRKRTKTRVVGVKDEKRKGLRTPPFL
jgi:hypothetical protein